MRSPDGHCAGLLRMERDDTVPAQSPFLMKFRISLVASLLAFSSICPAQQPKTSGEDVVAECSALTAKLRERADKARVGVEAAIAQASKAGALKTSTEAYYRDALARFKPVEAGLPTTEALYYPPRFDTSAEMEPINLAWDELRRTMEQIEKEATTQREKISRALGEAIEEAARTAEKPADLETARKLGTALQQLPESTRFGRIPTYGLSPTESLNRVLGAMNSALEALGKKDYAAMSLALQRVNGSAYGSSDSRITGVPFNVETVWTVFRERLATLPRTAALKVERAVEQALQAKKPEAECDLLITELDARLQEVERLVLDPNRGINSGGGLRSDTRNQLLSAFRVVVRINAAIANPKDDAGEYVSNLAPVVDGPFAMTPEFRVYLSKLATERTAAQKAVRERVERARQEESARLQAKQEQEQKDLRQKQVTEAEARLKAARDKVREQLKNASKPEELLAIADDLPALVSLGENRYSDRQENWQGLQMELRQIAAWWADPESISNSSRQSLNGDSSAAAFAVELRDLRARVARQIFAERFKAPELAKPPLSEMTPRAAAEQLAKQAGEKSDWLRAYEILRVLSAPNQAGDPSSAASERMTAIKAYLVGRNMELAGQYRDAVQSYRQVLNQLGENLPTKEAGERLQALQKEHPEAFADAAK